MILILCVFSLVIVPIAINEMYIGNKGYLTVWGGDDVLSFYGSVLSFIGTVFLGGLALWQNERLDKVNKNLTEQQYKPILTNSTMDTNKIKENHYTWFRTMEQDQNSIMINNGYSQEFTYYPYLGIGIRNIGLGPAVNICTYLHELSSVDGLESLDKIATTNIDNFYDKIHIKNYEYHTDGKIIKDEWQIYTDFNLGISDENNKLNLVFSFENITESIHSIIEFKYENILGNKCKQYLYMGYIEGPVMLPISKVYQ